MTYLQSSNFTPSGGPIAASASPGAVSASGWVDINGSVWSVDSSNELASTVVAGALNAAILARTGDTLYNNQRVRFTYVHQSTGSNAVYALPRMTRSGSNSNGYLAGIQANGKLLTGRVVAGALTVLTQSASALTLTGGTTYVCEVTIDQTNGTTSTITANLYASDGTTLIGTLSTTDTTSTLQNVPGFPGIYGNNNAAPSMPITAIQVLQNDVAGATAVTLTGPTTGTTGAPSSSFTVGANGSITGSVVVTPSDSAAGGSFSPTSVTITSASPTATFTYTAASNGAKTISVTNNGSLTNPSNITYTASSVAATATTLTGPTSGVTGVASTNFTVGANGSITGTVVITPSDSSAGGTFSPTSVSISSGSPTGTFTYTPGSTGAKTISTTNNGSLTNPSSITYTSNATSTTIPVTDANLFWSPANWDSLSVGNYGVSVASKQTTACGAYVKFKITGTTAVSLLLDPTNNSGLSNANMPIIMWSVNGGTQQKVQLTNGSTSVTLATGLSTGTAYTMEVYLFALQEASGDRWGASSTTSPTNNLRIQGFSVDGGGSTQAYSLIRPKRAVLFGDSITEGVRAAGTTTEPADHAQSSAWFTGPGMNAEYAVIGYGATGWAQSGSGSMPAFPSTWNFHANGRARTFGTVDYVFVMHGFNGAFTASTVTSWLTAARSAFGASTWIFIVSNPGGVGSSANSTGVSNYLTANPSDTKVAFLDLSTSIETRFYSGFGGATEYSVDGVHPLVIGNAVIGSTITAKAQAVLNPSSGGGGTGFVQGVGAGGIGITASGQLVAML